MAAEEELKSVPSTNILANIIIVIEAKGINTIAKIVRLFFFDQYLYHSNSSDLIFKGNSELLYCSK